MSYSWIWQEVYNSSISGEATSDMIKRILKRIVKNLIGTQIYHNPYRGMSIFNDVAEVLPSYRINVVFDVGANVGQSAKRYIARFPHSSVFCFEPVAKTYRQLERNMRGNKQVRCFRLALGSSRGKGSMLSDGTSSMNHLLNETTVSANNRKIKTESVDILTLDDFCQTNDVNYISYLKVDTEGGDLEVLKGAENMLVKQSIDLVEVEAGMNPNNKYHVPFESLKNYLEKHDYFLFGIYEQVEEWPTREPHLRRTNPVFISNNMILNYKSK